MKIALVLTYFLVLLLIGLLVLPRNRTTDDFFLAGRRIGFIPLLFATLASVMSGFVFVGGPGLFYRVGLSSIWIIISGSFTGALMCWVLAKPLHRLARDQGCLTVPELIFNRFQCRVSSGLAGLAVIFGVVGYMTAQLRALGVIMAGFLDVPLSTALLIGFSVLAFYCVAGGITAGIYTDVVQGILMLATSLLVFYFALSRSGGLERISASILAHEPSALDPFGTVGGIGALSWFFVFAVGSLGQPHVIHKFMMVEDLRVLRFFPLVLAASMLVCGLVWLGAGLSVKSLVLSGAVAPLDDPDQAMGAFLTHIAPTWLGGLVYVGIFAAIMSTVDSFVNVGSAALTRDIPRALGFRFKREVTWARIWTLVLFLLSLLFSIWTDSLVATLGILSFGLFAAALTPSLTLGLNWEKPGKEAARWSVGIGILSFGALYGLKQAGGLPDRVSPELVALVLSFTFFLLVTELRAAVKNE